MHFFRGLEATHLEPAGHFGHLEVANVVTQSESNMVVQLSYCPPGGGGEMHSHVADDQLFLVMEGELSFDTGTERFTLGPHDGVLFHAGEQHATRNDSDSASVSVVITVRR